LRNTYDLVVTSTFISATPPEGFFPTNHPLDFFVPAYLSRRYGSPLTELEFVAIDFETTGLTQKRDSIVEVAALRFRIDGTVLDEYASRVHPARGRASKTTEYHGLTDDDVKESPTFEQVWPSLARMMDGAVVLAHNLAFEDMFLHVELERAGLMLSSPPPGVCTMVASWTHLKSNTHNQKTLVRRATGGWPIEQHTALGDVRHLYGAICSLYPVMPDLRYVGPVPTSIPVKGQEVMHARPLVEEWIAWNSLPTTQRRFQARPEAVELIETAMTELFERDISVDWAARAMGAGQPGPQFVDMLGQAISSAIRFRTSEVDAPFLDRLETVLDHMESESLRSTVCAALLELKSSFRFNAPILRGQRWRIPKANLARVDLEVAISSLGGQVLMSTAERIDYGVHDRQTQLAAYEDYGTHVITTATAHRLLAEASAQSVVGAQDWIENWVKKVGATVYLAPLPFPLGDRPGRDYWIQEMHLEILDDERDPHWRWRARKYDDVQDWPTDDDVETRKVQMATLPPILLADVTATVDRSAVRGSWSSTATEAVWAVGQPKGRRYWVAGGHDDGSRAEWYAHDEASVRSYLEEGALVARIVG
jgi:DNA polymerase-3 subunit epsilon